MAAKEQSFFSKHIIVSTFFIILSMLTAGLLAGAAYLLPFIKENDSLAAGLSALFYLSFSLIFAKLLAHYCFRSTLNDFRIRLTVPKIRWLIIGFLLPVFVLGSLYLLGGKLSLNSLSWGTLAMGSLAAPIVEEIFFRGFLMTLFEIKYSRTIAVLVPSLIFALLHLLNGSLDFLMTGQLIIAGLSFSALLSYSVYETNSITDSVLIHAFWNFFTLLFTFSNSSFLFGGRYGIDISPVAVLAYVLALLIIYLFRTSDKKKA
ncbi:CPBP family intramembrane metalloprotease [Streptococcus chenjunshii]|uniref:CPBP family intramembrane metalloprotease n=1 Tax=Streptococcus chenjunshii TaxID=2173853 RepID=A0A372KPR4_9STRE|nr:type II CAAX endopeptidase family protein [Streptococcus chenjunshii]AXQ78480.1 CPBP family intramembrane metalloprotease [Streptococcus chenjunshii]RFU52059.1 CPBP family intramembrane metalloprotease [Streptococcus chenjunshii]RFU54251.1 CPBP family intramembrane metalloprotease [Streptococcus chenjunshii]